MARIYTIEKATEGYLSIMPHPKGRDGLKDEIKALKEAGVAVVVSLLTDQEIFEFGLSEEANLCKLNGINYLSFPIPDRTVPPFEKRTIDFIENLANHLESGQHIAIHCKRGLGRTGLLAASLLVRTGIEVEQAFNMLLTARGLSLSDSNEVFYLVNEEQREWVMAFAKQLRRSE